MYRRAINRNYVTMKPPTRPNRRTVLQSLGASLASSAALSGAATAYRGGLKGELAEVRSATADYNDPANAYDDGYFAPDGSFGPIPLEEVVEKAHAVCGMGYHFVNPDLMETEDRTKPQVLVYGEDDDENLILGAIEYLLPQAERKKTGRDPTSLPTMTATKCGKPSTAIGRSTSGFIPKTPTACSIPRILGSSSVRNSSEGRTLSSLLTIF